MDLFLTAYSIRKLIDAKKISDEIEASLVPALVHELRTGPVDHMNWDRIDDLYDLAKSRPAKIGLVPFCNQVIHSFVFMPAMGPDNGLQGFFVASDRDRRKRLWYFAIDDVIAAIDGVADDDVVSLTIKADSATGERVVTQKSNKPASVEAAL